jgi:predicted GTPase
MISQDFIHDVANIYAPDVDRRNRLADLVERTLQGLRNLDMEGEAQAAEQLKQTVTRETFKILIIGEFNTGKTTFINALLGAEVLPMKATPATAIINQLRYGEKPAARLFFRDQEKEPIDIPINKLNEYVLIKSDESAEEEIRESPFSHAEIWWPLELCKDNKVEIIDSPGLNESKVREKVTLDYLRRVDAVLFVMAATRFGPAQTEMATLNMLEEAGHQDLFFVINQWDQLRRQKDRDEVQGKAMKVLPTLTRRKDDIYFVSALDALEGRVHRDLTLEEQSGFRSLENSLHTFLANERGRIKAKRGARELLLMVRNVEENSIPTKRNLLTIPLGELQTRYASAKKDLDKLQVDKQGILDVVARERTQITNMIRSHVKEFFYATDSNVEEWARDYEIDKKMNLISKKQAEIAAQQLADHLLSKLSGAFKAWGKEVLTPFIEDRLQSLCRELEVRATDFENRLNDVRFTLSGSAFRQIEVGGGFELKIMPEGLKMLLPNVAVMVGVMLFGFSMLSFPFTILAGLGAAIATIFKMEERVKKTVVDHLHQALREKSHGQAEQIAVQLEEKLGEFTKTLEAGMERRIAEVNEYVQAAFADHHKGENEIKLKLALIADVKSELDRIKQELEGFIGELGNLEGD